MTVTRTAALAVTAALALTTASTVFAQAAQESAADLAAMKARSNISIMEGVLERAVVLGANNLNRRVRAVAPQDVLLLTGEASARGFRLDGYGLFFDVEVPVLRQSVAWSLRALMDQSGVPLGVALSELRVYVQSVQDPRTRQSLERALHRIELQVGGDVNGLTVASAASPGPAPSPSPKLSPAALAWLNDPNGAYTSEVKGALIDAMLEHSAALGIASGEYLTVAARDNERPSRVDSGAGDDVSSIILRIKGSDLQALLAGRMTLDEARRRVEVREY